MNPFLNIVVIKIRQRNISKRKMKPGKTLLGIVSFLFLSLHLKVHNGPKRHVSFHSPIVEKVLEETLDLFGFAF